MVNSIFIIGKKLFIITANSSSTNREQILYMKNANYRQVYPNVNIIITPNHTSRLNMFRIQRHIISQDKSSVDSN